MYIANFLCLQIKAANVKVRAVRESQDTPSRSPYHVPFTMLEQLSKR